MIDTNKIDKIYNYTQLEQLPWAPKMFEFLTNSFRNIITKEMKVIYRVASEMRRHIQIYCLFCIFFCSPGGEGGVFVHLVQNFVKLISRKIHFTQEFSLIILRQQAQDPTTSGSFQLSKWELMDKDIKMGKYFLL